MKNLLFALILISLVACSVTNLQENRLYKTKLFVGNFIDECRDKDGFIITTSKDEFHVDSFMRIPNNARCYVKFEERSRIQGDRYFKPFITFDDSEVLMALRIDFVTGDLIK